MNHGFLRVGVANPEIRVADPAYNAEKIVAIAKKAAKENVELLAFGELCVTGYTCGDLFFQKELTDGAQDALRKILDETRALATVLFVGLPVRHEGKLYNACAVLQRGVILGVVPKCNLPEYGEFNELRYFASGADAFGAVFLCGAYAPFGQMLFRCGEVDVGVEICEDLWSPVPPSSVSGALVTVNLSASSETVGKADKRRTLVKSQSMRTLSAYIYADAGRGESTGDMVFSGHGMIAEKGNILAENAPFADNALIVADIDTEYLLFERARNNTVRFGRKEGERQLTVVQLPVWHGALRRQVSRLPFVPEKDCDARAELILNIQAEGLRKRMQHTGLDKLVLGVSGGLDSALALLVCLRTLEKLQLPRKNLIAISMPGFGTTEETAQNALLLAKESKADYRIADIKASVTQHLKDIGHDLNVYDAAYENAQARMRTMILMDVANGEGAIVVGTGDLSEAALGWCTYNGDHMSMYGVNASVPKTLVKHLVAYEAARIGGKTAKTLDGILHTEISPELLPAKDGKIAQKTEDIIGSFDQNDFFLFYAVRCGCTPERTLLYAAAAFGGKPDDYAESLAKFYKRFFAAQFKRSCVPDGPKVGFSLSPRGDWRMPSDASVRLWLAALENNGN